MSISITNAAKEANMTWDDADFTWDEANGTWDVPGMQVRKESKTTLTISQPSK